MVELSFNRFKPRDLPGALLTSVVWTYQNFENNFIITQNLTKRLEESNELCYQQHISTKYFLTTPLIT